MKNAAELLAANLRGLRKERGFTQEKLAELAGLAWNSVQQIESCQRFPRVENISALARALDVSDSRLFQDPDDRRRPTVWQAMEVVTEALGPLLPQRKKKAAEGLIPIRMEAS